jgi:hypothetical protein
MKESVAVLPSLHMVKHVAIIAICGRRGGQSTTDLLLLVDD